DNDGVIEATLKARTHPGANGEVMLTAALDGDMPPGEDWVIAIHGKAPTAATAAGADPSACLDRAHRPDGRSDGAFALTLIPDAPAFEQPQEMDVVFMLDTSSSRTTSSLAAAARFIQGALEALNADDRFALVMFDVTARVLPGGLQAPREGNIAKALGALKTTLPMGATDVAGAFKAAEEQFARTARANTCIVYIGDAEATYGERAAEAIRKQAERTLAALKAGMYAVLTGPEVTGGAVNVSAWHARTLNALAQLSGGPVVQLTPDVRPADAGRKLVQSLGAPVLRHARLELRGPDGAVMDTTPAIVGGVFMDRALAAFGRYAAAGKATVTLSGTLDGQSYSRSWAIELPGQELANAVVEKLWARSRIGELQAFGDPQAANQAAALAKAHNLLSRNTAFLVLESERLYGDYRIARSRDNKPSADEMRVRMLAGTAVPPAARGLDAADSAAAAQNIRIAAKSTLGTTAAGFPISIGGTMVAVSLQEARVLERPEKLMHGDTILTHRQAFERRLRLSRLIAAERALPFEPETVFPQLWLQALERPPERLQGIFANAESPNVQDAEGLGDEAVWAVVLKQLSTPPTGWRQRNSPPEPVEEQLDRLLNLGKCSQVTLSDDGKTLCVDSHLLAHQILGSLLLAKPPQHYKATGHSEVLRVIITRREAAYPLEAVAPERLSAAWNFLAQLALVERQYQLSEELAGRALEASAAYATNGRPAGVLSHMIRGLAMEMRADYPAASQAYAAMLAGSRPLPKGGHALTYSALVTTMILGENVDGAIAVLERWCAQSYTPEVAGRLGEAYLLRDRRTDAIRAFSIPVEYGQANGADFAAPEDFLKRTPKG
ncbi:MAG: VWA domain-containing protein, partial [Planctomycetota bacterium]|nr:VWA domain-containing protein [Planctomycetota bacterium]